MQRARASMLCMLLGCVLALGPAARAPACEVALLLAIDVSGSVDAGEYRLQLDGLAGALRHEDVRAAILEGRAALAVMQWSGRGQQRLSIGWRQPANGAQITALALDVGIMARAFTASDTAVGEAIDAALAAFGSAPPCARRIIDISGDGPSNAGPLPAAARARAMAAGVEINAIAIEDTGRGIPITQFYRSRVITPGGFVMTARTFEDYMRAMREKLLRELVRPIS